MKRLVLLLTLLTVVSFASKANAQGFPYTNIALYNSGGNAHVLASALITVCTANASGIPCSPTVPLFTDYLLTQVLSNPFNADANGNYGFMIASGNYTVTVTGVAVQGYSYQISLGPGSLNTLTGPGSISGTFSGNYTTTGNNTHNGSETNNGTTNLNGSTNINGPLSFNASTSFKGPSPWVDITTYGARPLVTFPVANNLTYTATCTATSAVVTLNSAGQIQNGDFLALAGCGSGNSVGTSAPAAPTVTASIATGPMMSGLTAPSVAGSTTYSYITMWCDHVTMACTLPSSATTIVNGQATLGKQAITLTSGSLSGNIATVTTAAPHVMPIGCINANCPEILVWKETAANAIFTGFARVTSVADATHFTYPISASSTFGAITSFTGGEVDYFLGNHIACGAAPTTTSVCVVYGRASGSYAYIGHGRMGETYWDDWGTTLSGNPLEEGWIPNTPPATFQNNLLSTSVVSGGGTTTLTLAATASTSVTSQYAAMDQCPNFLSAAAGAQAIGTTGSQLFIPPLNNPNNPGQSAFVIGSYCALPGNLSVRQVGNLRLIATLQLQGNKSFWFANQNGNKNGGGLITETNIAPGIYLAGSYTNSSVDGWSVATTNANNALLVLSDESTANVIRNSFLTAGNGSLVSYTGISEVVRAAPFDLTYDNNNWAGDVVGSIANFGSTTTPNILFKPTVVGNPITGISITDGQMSAKGIAYIGLALGVGMDIGIKRIHHQGPVNPILTTDVGFNILQTKEERVLIDSTFAPALTLLTSPYRGTVTLDSTSIFANDTSGIPPEISGGFVADLEINSQDVQTPVGQNFNINNSQYLGVTNWGGNASSPPFDSINPYRYGPLIIPSGNQASFGYEILVTPSSAVVSAGGSVPVTQQCYTVAPIFASGAEGIPSGSQCVTPTGGNQTVTVTIPVTPGATAYTVCRNGLRANNGVGIAGPTYVDTFSFAGVGCTKVSGDGYPHYGPDAAFAPIFGCVEQAAPSGRAGWDLLYCDSTNHAWKLSNNNGSFFNVAQVISATSAAFATATTAGTCVQSTTAVTGATTAMTVSISPVSTPGVGSQWSAFVSSAGNVTINECAVATSAGGTIAFNIRVTP